MTSTSITTGRSSAGGSGLSQLAGFRAACEELAGRSLADPAELHDFSVRQPRLFWRALLEWSQLPWSGSAETVLVGDDIESARFFPDVSLNHAEALLRPLPDVDDEAPALVSLHADRPTERYSRRELRVAVSATATALAGTGLTTGDRVVVIAPSTAATAVAVLGLTALGVSVATATPDMGIAALLGRFEQLEPTQLVLDRADMPGDRNALTAALLSGLPSVRRLLVLDDDPLPEGLHVPAGRLADLRAGSADAPPVDWPRLPFDHPLFVMSSSGTTGPPKAIVHGQGGTLLEHVKEHRLHGDLRPDDVLYFHTTTAWMMWHWQLSALAAGATIVLNDAPVLGPTSA